MLYDFHRVILPKALVLQDECFGKNYSSFLDFTRNYKRTSGIFVPWPQCNSSIIIIIVYFKNIEGIHLGRTLSNDP